MVAEAEAELEVLVTAKFTKTKKLSKVKKRAGVRYYSESRTSIWPKKTVISTMHQVVT